MTEPVRNTALRNGTIALGLGVILALAFGRPALFPQMAVVALWPSFGGHFVEILFLNYLRPLLPNSRPLLTLIRLGMWFVAGTAFAFCMKWTAVQLGITSHAKSPVWWIAGLSFIGIELLAHLGLLLSGRRNFYSSTG